LLIPDYFAIIVGSFAHISVLVFFILSGFVIGYTTKGKFTFNLAKIYLIKRFIRIYPIYLVALFLGFLASPEDFRPEIVLGHLVFMQGFLVPLLKSNGPLWSLHYEVLFYLLFLFIWRFNVRIYYAISFCIFMGIISVFTDLHILKVIGYFTLWLLGYHLSQLNRRSFHRFDLRSTSKFWIAIFLSVAFGWSNSFSILIQKYFPSHMSDAHISFIPDIILSGMLIMIVAAPLGLRFSGYKISFVFAVLGCCSSVFYGLHLGLLATMQSYQMALIFLILTPICTFLFRNICLDYLSKVSFLGSISYGLYVVHNPMIGFVYKLIPTSRSGVMLGVSFILICVVSTMLAWFLEHYLHPRIANELRKYLIPA
jgi:peptidoglycan/LPS O-acetylase OafA/YrhL